LLQNFPGYNVSASELTYLVYENPFTGKKICVFYPVMYDLVYVGKNCRNSAYHMAYTGKATNVFVYVHTEYSLI